MSEPLILAIDLGTQSLRVTALGLDGRRQWSSQRPVETISDGISQQQDAAQWRDLLWTGLQEAAKAGVIPAVILASGPLAGWLPVDGSGDPMGPAVMYNDVRSEPDIATVEAALPTGASVPRLTIADPLPHALRMAREEAATFSAATHFLDATGWLNFVLTGQATLSAYTALRLYEPGTRVRLGLGNVPFGRTVDVGETIGALDASLAQSLGWPRVPVVAATFDSKCAYLGSGISAPGDALDISGTVTSFGVVSATRVVDKENRIYSVPFGENACLVRGSTAAAGSIIEWARETLALPVDELNRLALEAPIDAETDPVFVPYLSGARAPLWRPRARGSITGLSMRTSRAELARCIYAGLALSVRHIVDTIVSCGADVGSIRLAGGLSRSAALAQIKADILGRPVTVMEDAELTTIGMTAIGAAYLGVYANVGTAARAMARDGATFYPRLHAAEADALYARYLRGAGLSVSLVPGAGSRTSGQLSVA